MPMHTVVQLMAILVYKMLSCDLKPPPQNILIKETELSVKQSNCLIN